MTLIDYFNQFWKEDEEKHFTQTETRLYTYLLYLWNSTGRKEWFECKTSMIEHYADINPMTLTRCRKSLKERKLIDFKQGSAKGKYPYYSLLCIKDNVKVDVKDNVKVDVKDNVKDVLTHIEYRVKEKEDTSNEASKRTARKPVEINFDEVQNAYNEMLSPPFSRCTKMTTARRSAIKARVSEHGINSVITAFQKVKDSQFLHGKKWCAFDWIFKPANFIKILEGNYDNGGQIQTTDSRTSSKPSFNNFNESEAKHVGRIESIEL